MNDSNSIEWNSIEPVDKTILSEQRKFQLSEIIGAEYYFYQQISQRALCSKTLIKYVTIFNYIDKILIVLSSKSAGVSIISFISIVAAPVGIVNATLTLNISLITEIVKKLLNITR